MNWSKRLKILSVLLAAALLFLGWRQYDRRFTPERWAETDISRRGKLVDSLLEQSGGLEGMTRAEVEELLGADMEGNQMEERLLPGGGSEVRAMLVYAAGRPWAIFPEYLYITLEDGRVADARVVAD